MLNGSVFITGNYSIIEAPNRPSIIVNMDEEHKLSKIMHNAIEGTCLLPPVDAKIKEVDGDEMSYNTIYDAHLKSRADFMAAIIMYLHKGGNIIFYLPDEYNYTKDKFIQFIFRIYGIKIGDIDNPANGDFFYDMNKMPLWLNILYGECLISAIDWLRMMPLGVYLPDGTLGIDRNIFMRIIYEINPYTEDPLDIRKKAELVKEYHIRLHQYPDLREAIKGVDMNVNVW